MDRIRSTGEILPVKTVKINKTGKQKAAAGINTSDSLSIAKKEHHEPLIQKGMFKPAAKAEVEEQPVVSDKPAKAAPVNADSIFDYAQQPDTRVVRVDKMAELSPPINPRNARVIDKAFDVLKNNRMHIKGHTFTTPSKVVDETVDYEGKQWLWDSCFHAMVLSDQEPEIAMEELRAVVANQHEDGFVPHMNYFRGDAKNLPEKDQVIFKDYIESDKGKGLSDAKKTQFHTTFWTKDDHSDITQPPIVGMAVEQVFKATGDKAFVKEMLPAMKSYYNYLHDKRDPDGDNLVSIIHPWESGWDHSQRWDETIGVTQGDKPHISKKKLDVFCSHKKNDWDLDKVFESDKFNVEPVDFNVLYALNMESLSRMCGEVGDKAGEKMYKARADATKKAINNKMWDGDKYVDLCGKAEKKSGVKSAAMFYPLMLDGDNHGKELIENHLMNPNEFNVEYPIPTTSVDHPLYRPGEYWRGNVWQNVNYFVWKGLQNVIQRDPDYKPAKMMADKIKNSSFELLDKFGFSEYFNPNKGDGHGAQTFGWNGIVRFMEPDYK